MLTASLKTRLKIIIEGGWHQRYAQRPRETLREQIHDTSASEEYAWQEATVQQRQFIRVPVQKNVY